MSAGCSFLVWLRRPSGCLLLSTAALLLWGASITTAQTGKGASGNDAIQIANFEDIADRAGLGAITVFGGADAKQDIIETTGTGVAILDYDNDGWPDIFIVTGTTI